MTQLRSVTCHMGSHSVACYRTQVNTLRLNRSHTGRYSIYHLPRRDGIKLLLHKWQLLTVNYQRVTYTRPTWNTHYPNIQQHNCSVQNMSTTCPTVVDCGAPDTGVHRQLCKLGSKLARSMWGMSTACSQSFCWVFPMSCLKITQQESRAIRGRTARSWCKFDTLPILHPLRAVSLPQLGFRVSLCLQTAVNHPVKKW